MGFRQYLLLGNMQKDATFLGGLVILEPDNRHTLESRIEAGQGINVGNGKFVRKNKRRALNRRRA